VLDLLQQLHGRIRHRHPAGPAVLVGQGEAGAIGPTTVLVASTTRPNLASRSPSRARVARSSPTVRATSCPSTAIQDPSSSALTQRLLVAVDRHIPRPGRQPEPAGTSPPPSCSTTNHGGRQVHPDSQIPAATQGVVSGWPFRAQLPVRTVAAPEGAFSAQTPPTRPFSSDRMVGRDPVS
jgi:hypothetical protein